MKFTPALSIQERQDDEYMDMLRSALSTPGYYFSYKTDLTHTIQHREAGNEDVEKEPLHLRVDHRFYWNRYLQSSFADRMVVCAFLSEYFRDFEIIASLRQFAPYLLPVMCGFVSISRTSLHGIPAIFTLISRRSSFRAG